MTLLRRLSWLSLALAAFILVFLAVREGVGGAIFLFGAILFAVPPAVIGVLLRSSRRTVQKVAGVFALIDAVPYALSLPAAFSTPPGEPLNIANGLVNIALGVVPLVLYLVIFWAAVLRHQPSGHAPVAPGHGVG